MAYLRVKQVGELTSHAFYSCFPTLIMCLGSSIRSSLASHFVDPKPSLTTGYQNFVKFINECHENP